MKESISQRAFIEVITGQSMLFPSNLTFQYLSIFLNTICLSIATVTVVMVALKFSCSFKTESAENRKFFVRFFLYILYKILCTTVDSYALCATIILLY